MSQLISGVANVAATAMGFLADANSNEFAFVAPDTGLSVFDFDALIQFEVRVEGMVVSAPVEQGSFAAYNKVDSPNYIEVQLARQGTDDELQAALKTLDDLQTSATQMNFVTPVTEYQGYTLESYDFAMTRRDGLGVLYIRLHLIEVREVTAQYTDTKAISVKNAKRAGDASTTDRGKVQAKTPTTSEAGKYDAELYKIFGGSVV